MWNTCPQWHIIWFKFPSLRFTPVMKLSADSSHFAIPHVWVTLTCRNYATLFFATLLNVDFVLFVQREIPIFHVTGDNNWQVKVHRVQNLKCGEGQQKKYSSNLSLDTLIDIKLQNGIQMAKHLRSWNVSEQDTEPLNLTSDIYLCNLWFSSGHWKAMKVIIKRDWHGGCISAHLLMADICVLIVAERDSDMRHFTSWAAWIYLYLQQTTAELLFPEQREERGVQICSRWAVEPPPDQSMLLHLQAMSGPASSSAHWRSTEENIRLPTAPLSLFILLFSPLLCSYFSPRPVSFSAFYFKHSSKELRWAWIHCFWNESLAQGQFDSKGISAPPAPQSIFPACIFVHNFFNIKLSLFFVNIFHSPLPFFPLSISSFLRILSF